MTKIESKGSTGLLAPSELVKIKKSFTPEKTILKRVLIAMFVVSLIIAVSLLLVAFLTPGLSTPVYLSLLIATGCVAIVGLSVLVSTLFFKCLLGKEKKVALPIKEDIKMPSRRPSVSSDTIVELGISAHDWKKFDSESKEDIRSLLQATDVLITQQGDQFPFQDLHAMFLQEIFQINEDNWESNKLTMQAAAQALREAIHGLSDLTEKSIRIMASEDMVERALTSALMCRNGS